MTKHELVDAVLARVTDVPRDEVERIVNVILECVAAQNRPMKKKQASRRDKTIQADYQKPHKRIDYC